MSILRLLLDYRTREIMQGRNPKRVEITGWQRKILGDELKDIPMVLDPDLAGSQPEIIYGMELITV